MQAGVESTIRNMINSSKAVLALFACPLWVSAIYASCCNASKLALICREIGSYPLNNGFFRLTISI